MTSRPRVLLFGLAFVVAVASASRAQDPAPSIEAPAHLSVIDGVVILERDGRAEAAPSNMPLLAGDRLRTETGRAEVLFTDGSALHLDHYTTVDFQSDDLLRLLAGRVRLAVAGADAAVNYRVDSPAATVTIMAPGEYRVAIGSSGDVELAVLRGAADLRNAYGATTVRAGERAFARGASAPSYPYAYNSAYWDAFDRWSEARRDARVGVASSPYLPPEIRHYGGAFDRYGYWDRHATYGHVWYPAVPLTWRPYHRGRWTNLSPFGWTWIGFDPFSWPTHHFGRWGITAAGAYFWIPGGAWAPAWVSWAYAPGYVGWCPLGWNNRPLININIVNVRRGWDHDPWNVWTVVRSRSFGVGTVAGHVVDARAIDTRTRGAFVPRAVPVVERAVAVPRSTRAIRRAGTAVPRNGAIVDSADRPYSTPAASSRVAPGVRQPANRGDRDLGHVTTGRRLPGTGTAVPRSGAPADDSSRSGTRAAGRPDPEFGDRAVRTPQAAPTPRAVPRGAPPYGAEPRSSREARPEPYSRPAPPPTYAPRSRVPSPTERVPGRVESPRVMERSGPPRAMERSAPPPDRGAPSRVAPPSHSARPSAPPAGRAAPRAEPSRPGGNPPAASAPPSRSAPPGARPSRGGRGGV
jgi:hypothetical protein